MGTGGGGASRRLTNSPLTVALPRLSVLFVDPDGSAAYLAEALASICRIASVPSAQHALSAIPALQPDLIVTDVDLPDISGPEFIATLRTGPTTRHMLLMVLTAHRTLQAKIAAFQAGADDYLVEPVSMPQFLLHIQALSRFRKVLGNSSLGF